MSDNLTLLSSLSINRKILVPVLKTPPGSVNVPLALPEASVVTTPVLALIFVSSKKAYNLVFGLQPSITKE